MIDGVSIEKFSDCLIFPPESVTAALKRLSRFLEVFLNHFKALFLEDEQELSLTLRLVESFKKRRSVSACTMSTKCLQNFQPVVEYKLAV
jgi:hypothetical protein